MTAKIADGVAGGDQEGAGSSRRIALAAAESVAAREEAEITVAASGARTLNVVARTCPALALVLSRVSKPSRA